MDARRFDEILRRGATGGTSRRTLLKGIAGAALASGGAVIATSRVDAASACENRQRQICKDVFAKGDPLQKCYLRGLTQGQCIQECTAERTLLKCS
jgi:deoxycytidylate deaminase